MFAWVGAAAGGADPLQPWWVAIAIGIVSTLAAVIGKLWSENNRLRDKLVEQAGAHAAALNELQERYDELAAKAHHEHKRDLRIALGWPTSIGPPVAPVQPTPPRRGKRQTKPPQ